LSDHFSYKIKSNADKHYKIIRKIKVSAPIPGRLPMIVYRDHLDVSIAAVTTAMAHITDAHVQKARQMQDQWFKD
jgi:hypothetical protein